MRWAKGDHARTVFAILVIIDAAFFIMFGLRGAGIVEDDGFILTYDRSYAEMFQYVKLACLAVLLAAISLRERETVYLGLSALYAFMLVDDYAMLHENWGEQIAEHLEFQAGWMLQPYDFGELIVFAGYTAIVGALLLVGYLSAGPVAKRFVWKTFGLFVLLGVFVVGVDLLHALALPELISNSIGAVEDSGEMVVVSCMVWHALAHIQGNPASVTVPT